MHERHKYVTVCYSARIVYGVFDDLLNFTFFYHGGHTMAWRQLSFKVRVASYVGELIYCSYLPHYNIDYE